MEILCNSQGKIYISENKAFYPYNKSKYGIIIDNLLGDVDSNGILQSPSAPSGNIVFSGVKEITSAYALAKIFYNRVDITTTISFPELTLITGERAFEEAFLGCTSLTTVSFPELITINSNRAFYSTFSNCTSLTTVSFPELAIVSGSSTFYYAFAFCFYIQTAYFPKLSYISADKCFDTSFSNCTLLTDIYFNALTTSSFGNYSNQFSNLLKNTGTSTTKTVHFPSNLQSTISGLTGYPLFGGTSGYVTLSFDLPATS